jgi:hypothetical protein
LRRLIVQLPHPVAFAVVLLGILSGCASESKDVRSEPLMVPAKTSIWTSEDWFPAKDEGDPMGTPFVYDGKTK